MTACRTLVILLLFTVGSALADDSWRRATITLQDNSRFDAVILKLEKDVLHLSKDGEQLTIPLAEVRRLEILERSNKTAKSRRRLRVGLARIELPSVHGSAKWLDRIGADWDFVAPEADLKTLQQFDVICFATGWAQLDGLADLAPNYHAYVQQGGGLLFSSPDPASHRVEGASPAMQLLPCPLDALRSPSRAEQSVVHRIPGRPHPLTEGILSTDLPFPYGILRVSDERWDVLAQSPGSKDWATLVATSFGQGRVVVHTAYDVNVSRGSWSDEMVVRVLKWLARCPDQEVREGGQQLGPRRWPEYVLRLKRDYEQLIKSETPSTRAALERARDILAHDAQQGSTWTSYQTALELVNQHRSKAAIPMLLVLLSDDRLQHDNYQAKVFETFAVLTCTSVVGNAPEEVALQWWFPRRDQLIVKTSERPQAQLSLVVEQLLKIASQREPGGLGRKPPLSVHTVSDILNSGFRLYAGECRDMLDKRIFPDLMAVAAQPQKRWLMVGPLAAMYHLRRAPELDTLIRDTKVPAAQRVVAAAAVYRVNKSVDVDALTTMFRDTEEVDLRQAIIWLLGQSEDPGAAETIIACLQEKQPQLSEMAKYVITSARGSRDTKVYRDIELPE